MSNNQRKADLAWEKFPVPEFGWSVPAIFASSLIEDLTWRGFLSNYWYPTMYGGLLLFCIIWSIIRAMRKTNHHKIRVFRSVAFILGIAILSAGFPGDITRIVVIFSSLLYVVVTLRTD